MKKVITLLVLLALAAFGTKLFLENKYESEIDKLLITTGASGMVSYENVKVGFDSSITINKISITPPDFGDTVAVRSVQFKSSDPMMPFKGPEIFGINKYPEQFSVDIKGVDIDAVLLEEFNDKSQGEPCRSGMSIVRYSAAGLDRINSDMFFEVDLRDPISSGGNIKILDQISSTTIELDMDATQMAGVALGGDVPITKIELTTELDGDLMKEVIDYCSDLFKVTPEVFLNKVVGSPKFSQNTFGSDLGVDMRKSMVEFVKGGKRFSFRARPKATLGSYQQIVNLDPDQILRRLNLSVSLDGLRVPIIVARETVEEIQERMDEEKGIKAERSRQREYIKVDLASPKQYVGQRIRISRKGDKKRIKGRMSGFANNKVAVEVYRYGGEMTLNVPVDEIRKFEIYK